MDMFGEEKRWRRKKETWRDTNAKFCVTIFKIPKLWLDGYL
jgi:hypothetical protein